MTIDHKLRFRPIEVRLNTIKYETTTEGFWLYKKVKIARSGLFPWQAHELEKDGIFKEFPELRKSDKVQLMRNDDTFTQDVIDSMNGKSLTLDHPRNGLVTSKNYKEEHKGTIFNSFFENGILFADVLIQDERTQKEVERGTVEVSIGYIYERPVKFEKNLHFIAYEVIISMNHLAIVRNGRAGPICRLNKNTHKTGENMLEDEFEVRLNKTVSGLEALSTSVSNIANILKTQTEREENRIRLNAEKIKAEKKKKREERENKMKEKEEELDKKEKGHKEKEEDLSKRENELSVKLADLDSRSNDIFFTPENRTTIEAFLEMIPGDQVTAYYEGKMKKGNQGTMKEVVANFVTARKNKLEAESIALNNLKNATDLNLNINPTGRNNSSSDFSEVSFLSKIL